MRLELCGGGDCPDWLLAGIHYLSQLSSVKHKLLCATVIKALLEDKLDISKVEKLTSDVQFELVDADESSAITSAAGAVAVSSLSYILQAACRHRVDQHQLCVELQQLGLPVEHAAVVGQQLHDADHELRRQLVLRGRLQLPSLTAVSSWEVQMSAAADGQHENLAVQMALETTWQSHSSSSSRHNEGKLLNVRLNICNARVLLKELRKADGVMKQLATRNEMF